MDKIDKEVKKLEKTLEKDINKIIKLNTPKGIRSVEIKKDFFYINFSINKIFYIL